MLFVPKEKAKEAYKKLLDERNERRAKEREEYFRRKFGPDNGFVPENHD